MLEKSKNRLGPALHVPDRAVGDGVRRDLAEGWDVARDHRCARGQRLQDRQTEPLTFAGEKHELGTMVQRCERWSRQTRGLDQSVGDPEPGQQIALVRQQPCALLDQDQVGMTLPDLGKNTEQHVEPFPGNAAAHVQQKRP